jgi:hypothetical protein
MGNVSEAIASPREALFAYWLRNRQSMEAQDPGSSTRLLIVVAISLICGVATVLITR